MKKIIPAVFLALFIQAHGFLFSEAALSEPEDAALEEYMTSLSPSALVSQIFLVNIEGSSSYYTVEKAGDIFPYFEDEPLIPGGALFFSYNIADSAEKIIQFTESEKFLAEKFSLVPPYNAVDQEGGYVNRLKEITSPLPSNRKVSSSLSPSQAFVLYSLQASQLASLGFHMNLSPVAEPLNGENEAFLETRSFGSVPETVAFSIAEIAAFKKHGVAPVAKHFPGNAGTDPHTGLPEIELSFNELAKTSLIPFRFVLTSSPDAVLMSHARVSCVDSGVPSCLSSVWIKDYLKNKFCFKGLVISDDIFMAALEKNGFPPDKASVMALEAGVDVIMLSEKRFSSAARALLKKAEKDVQFSKLLHDAEKRVLAFKIQKGILCFKTDDKGKLKVITSESVSKENRLSDFKASYRQGLDFYRENF